MSNSYQGPHWPPGVPLPPKDWQGRLQDYAMVKNLLNGDSIAGGPDIPVLDRLMEFLSDPENARRWHAFNQGRSRL